jgi:hypothetical protein
MEDYVWVKRTDEWIEANPNKGTMYKVKKEVGIPTNGLMFVEKKKYIKPKYRESDSGVYVIICEKSKSAYVGQSISMDNRMRNHKMNIINDRMYCINSYREMKRDYALYGMNSFEFIKYKFITDQDEMLREEEFTMHEFLEKGYKLYNTLITMSNNLIYCPNELKDIAIKLFIKAKNNPELLSKIKELL